MPSDAKKPYLPKWAEEEMNTKDRLIRVLGDRVAELEATLAGNGKSMFSAGNNTSLDLLRLPSSVRDMDIELPNGFKVNVHPASGNNGGIGTKDTIQIQVNSGHGINVFPQSSNTIHIGPRSI